MMTTPPTPPSGAIDRLLAEQQYVLDAFEAARDAGISTPQGVERLRAIEDYLAQHLAVVDRSLYPLLRRLASSDARIARALARGANEEDIAARVDSFFMRHAQPDSPTFFAEWGAMYVAVQRRFRLERTLLLPALRESGLAKELTLPGAGRLRTGSVRCVTAAREADKGNAGG